MLLGDIIALYLPDNPAKVSISFEHGVPTAIEDAKGQRIENPLEIVTALNELAAMHGVGRNDVIVNRLMGLKNGERFTKLQQLQCYGWRIAI